MYIARMLYPVKVLGPGRRLGIWFQGCPRRCKGCSNPELWEQEPERLTSAGDVFRLTEQVRSCGRIDGFTLSGGDPFFQPDALRELLPRLNGYPETSWSIQVTVTKSCGAVIPIYSPASRCS